MRVSVILYIKLYFCLTTVSFCKRYDNFTLFRAVPVTSDDLNYLQNMSSVYNVDFWRPPGNLRMPVEFLVSPNVKDKFVKEASEHEIYLTTIMENVQSEFDKQIVKPYVRRKMETFDWTHYYRLDDIHNWMRDLSVIYNDEVKVISIGKTSQGRKILGLCIILKGSKRRSSVIIEGGIHAREWIGPAFVTYLINQIISAKTSKDEMLRKIAYTYEWYFFPVLNADGYEYSHTTDRLWRKNRNGAGVDINRNFGVAFGTIGISKTPESETYCGSAAFSEHESNALAEFVISRKDNLEYYIAFHSYGQFIILPYAYSKIHSENYNEAYDIAIRTAELIANKYGTKYTPGTAFDTVGYMTSGVSGCWVKKAFKTRFVFTFEMRDNGAFGFALPPHLIKPACEETMDGLRYMLTPKGPSVRIPTIEKSEIKNKIENSEKSYSSKAFVMENVLLMLCLVIFFSL